MIMSIIRTHKNNNFSVLDNRGLRDKTLKWAEKGLLAYLLTLPDDWKIYVSELAKHSKNCKDATARIINSLIEKKYIDRKILREGGKFKGYEYHVYEAGIQPYPESSDTATSDTDIPDTEKQALLNTNLVNTKKTKNLSNTCAFFEQFWNAYDKKADRSKCEKKWARLSEKEKLDIFAFVPKYVLSTPDKQYRKHPATFLNNRSWENEIITSEKDKPIMHGGVEYKSIVKAV